MSAVEAHQRKIEKDRGRDGSGPQPRHLLPAGGSY